ncbi:MAG: CopD family protein [Janthinobacterium lividum]
MTDPLVAIQVGIAALQDLLLALVVGSLACDVAQGRASAATLKQRLATIRRSATLGLLFAALVYLWLQAAVMSGSSLLDAASALAVVITQSHFGSTWSIGCAGLLLATLGALARNARCSRWLSGLGAAIYVMGKVGASHAADGGDFSLAEGVHWLHVCATAWWVGSVVLACSVLRALALQSSAAAYLRFAERLSAGATIAFACVVASGVFNVVHIAARTATPLLHSSYGALLGFKLTLVAAATLLATWNRIGRLPQLRRLGCPASADATAAVTGASRRSTDTERDEYRSAARSFERTMACEAVVLVAVVLVAAVLAHTSPTGV